VRWIHQDVPRSAVLDEHPIREDRNAIGVILREVHIVRCDQQPAPLIREGRKGIA
jgi:hypothetical protein